MKENNESRSARLWLLFITTFTISMTANSGYAILSVLRKTFVEKHKWYSDDEMNDLIAVAQSSPGPVGINAAAVVGYGKEGLPGALCGVFGVFLPPLLIMIAVTFFYQVIVANPYVQIFLQGMQAGVLALLVDVILGLFKNITAKKEIYVYVVMALCFLFIRVSKLSLFFLILACVAAGVFKCYVLGREVNR